MVFLNPDTLVLHPTSGPSISGFGVSFSFLLPANAKEVFQVSALVSASAWCLRLWEKNVKKRYMLPNFPIHVLSKSGADLSFNGCLLQSRFSMGITWRDGGRDGGLIMMGSGKRWFNIKGIPGYPFSEDWVSYSTLLALPTEWLWLMLQFSVLFA